MWTIRVRACIRPHPNSHVLHGCRRRTMGGKENASARAPWASQTRSRLRLFANAMHVDEPTNHAQNLRPPAHLTLSVRTNHLQGPVRY
jgi:hypothetical protein